MAVSYTHLKDLLSAPGIEGDVHPPVCICMVLQFEIGVIKIFRRTALPQNIGQKLLHRENSQPMGPVWFHQSCQQPADWHLPGAYLKNIQEIELRSSRLWNQWPELIQKCGKMCIRDSRKTVPYRNSGRGRFFCSPEGFIPGAGHTDVHLPECPAGSDGAS